MAERLRDLSQPIDVPLLDATVGAFYGTGSKEERSAADQILRELQNNPDTWLQVVHILQNSQNLNTKFFALQVLENVIKYRWNALPAEQRDGIKNYISDVIVQLSSNETSFRKERLYVNKLNVILVQVLKHEWPARWQSFIPDLVSAAKSSETICENCMAILKVAALQFGDFYDAQYVKMYTIFMAQLQTIIPHGTNFAEAYTNGSSEEQCHIRVLESAPANRGGLLMGLEYLIGISYVDDTEVFKVCLDYWNLLVLELFEAHHNLENPTLSASLMGLQTTLMPEMVDGLGSPLLQRRQLYSVPLSKLRTLMICRMAKPEEVLIVEDENGNIVRETMKDIDVLVQYKIMRETLIYLSHLDHEDTEQQMLKKLNKQLSGEEWSWNNLNTLCWAIGSISGSMMEEQRSAADQILRELQNNPDTWLQVVHILQNSQNLNTKFFALQVLENVIKYRWNALPAEQRDGIKNYISDVIVQLSSNETSFRKERLYVNKLNVILVQVLKHEWPARWQSFIPDLVSAAKSSETICENCMAILKVAALQFGDFYDAQYVKMYTIFMAQLQTIIPHGTNFAEAYTNGSSEEQCHIRVLESAPANRGGLLMGLEYLIGISYVDDTEVFKVCLDYWNLLVLELFEAHHNLENPTLSASLMGLQTTLMPEMVDGLGSPLLQRRQLYSVPLSKLRTLMICRMAKPEEVLIVEDENGNIVRETMKDIDVLVQYKIMRETLIYLSHLDHEDTEQQMLKKLNKQLSGEEWSWNNLNTLCWAIGSISGSMMEEQENRFLVMVIRDLLNLCEITKGKDNKAVIASNIMYVVGQYPRFLRAHWKFLKTVVNKLFEFMHETHPGVQDMACDTFLKIVQKCKRKFVTTQLANMQNMYKKQHPTWDHIF
ncbi:hypothetical protein ZIOFF_013334 [Zingiber officinale]|uniref:Importin N-terminal domain-containing protein n=1 Tax=Zingiber officinale TaxID=94328 RepID=A0A8J5HBM7_ZINOF|nr:hypothetical protein ZIOFF_013334 [Zingiber officinale]